MISFCLRGRKRGSSWSKEVGVDFGSSDEALLTSEDIKAVYLYSMVPKLEAEVVEKLVSESFLNSSIQHFVGMGIHYQAFGDELS